MTNHKHVQTQAYKIRHYITEHRRLLAVAVHERDEAIRNSRDLADRILKLEREKEQWMQKARNANNELAAYKRNQQP